MICGLIALVGSTAALAGAPTLIPLVLDQPTVAEVEELIAMARM